jgi:outer membrane immunogenic protein
MNACPTVQRAADRVSAGGHHSGKDFSMQKLFAGVALSASLALFASSALADGMARGGSAGSGCSSYNWSGFYIGAQVGQADLRSHANTPDILDQAYFQQDDGWLLGGQIGFNMQKCMAVYGIEADLAWTDVGRSHDTLFGAAHIRNEANWVGTIRTRAGIAVDNLLLFVTGGIAFADFDKSFGFTGGPSLYNDSDVRWGWTVGFGTEYALTDRISWRSDVLYTSFENDTHTVDIGIPFAFRTHDEMWMLRSALNFKIGGDRRLEERAAPLK